MKNKGILLGIIIIAFLCIDLHAQQIQNNIYVNDTKVYQEGDSIIIEMTIDGSKAKLASNEVLLLTPVIKTDNNIKELYPIIIKGNIRYKADKRTQFFQNNRMKNDIEPLRINEVSVIYYKQNIPYEQWMQEGIIYMKQLITGCAECLKAENWDIIGDGVHVEKKEIEKPVVKFMVSYVVPETEIIKNRDYEGSAFLDFQVGKSIIIPEFRDNYSELNKIENVLNQLKENNNATIKMISLIGFASPEGNYQTNRRLSSSRAQALEIYIQKKFNYSNDLFNVEQGGEDWNGLEKLVSVSDLSDKSRILDIINSSALEDVKEQRLKALSTTYRILLEEYFPKLRRVYYRLNYVVRAFSVEEGKVIVKTNPGQMSLNEMFLVANSYEKGSKEFKDVFDIAVRIFPKDMVANINAAAIALEDGNIQAAHRYLDNYRDVSTSWNNLGVLYTLEGNLDKAKEFFNKAQNIGVTEATENLKKINQLEDYDMKIKEIREIKTNK
ncbi:DUF3868 domain-containing protein [Dysgonomonas sp. Marseille-P4677]|uniref:DUF3868 domain-containing protein n=1 Tax=Dysgonomonas sp. Marseille-P4677 TaxID=2364790 RepID=UPI001911A4FF|nr:DUF3868 domain-containing protein [Dysgonomonas sp. Marseille-P4677]MBK5721694.1 DUF3868 domain-containing protein [Dysgonomonas sp. Marseille-P4677]